jgi:hypothetical protein
MPLIKVNGTTYTYTANAQNRTYDYDLQDIGGNQATAAGLSVQAVYTDATPVHKTFVAANVKTNVQSPASSITITAHGFSTGLKVALTGTNLPTGLTATNYWVIVIDANTISLASSLANAVAGTKVAITGAGTTADADLTPATLSQAVKLQCSNDGDNFVDISGDTVTITSAGTSLWDLGFPCYRVLRVVTTATSGAMTLTLIFNAVNAA